MIFAMVSTARSVPYTEVALQSLFRNTAFADGDKIALIINDLNGVPDFEKIGCSKRDLIVKMNSIPLSFAGNMNIGIQMALDERCDLICLNNDIVFTPHWLAPIIEDKRAIVLPACNQQFQYQYDGLNLMYFMTLADFGERYAQLEHVAARHSESVSIASRRDMLMPFYCVYLPYQILAALGPFDESFGVGGAEDVDYRVRALLAGYDVRYDTRSYVLHFMGQSTWRSGEAQEVIAARNEMYRKRFREKWGSSLASLLLPGVEVSSFVRTLDVGDFVRRDDYLSLIQACLEFDPPSQDREAIP